MTRNIRSTTPARCRRRAALAGLTHLTGRAPRATPARHDRRRRSARGGWSTSCSRSIARRRAAATSSSTPSGDLAVRGAAQRIGWSIRSTRAGHRRVGGDGCRVSRAPRRTGAPGPATGSCITCSTRARECRCATIAATWAVAADAMTRGRDRDGAVLRRRPAFTCARVGREWVRMTTDGRVEWSPGCRADLFVSGSTSAESGRPTCGAHRACKGECEPDGGLEPRLRGARPRSRCTASVYLALATLARRRAAPVVLRPGGARPARAGRDARRCSPWSAWGWMPPPSACSTCRGASSRSLITAHILLFVLRPTLEPRGALADRDRRPRPRRLPSTCSRGAGATSSTPPPSVRPC